ncbi:MAG TPA: nuclease-related domain-containing protein [Clostridiaceae bacterium]
MKINERIKEIETSMKAMRKDAYYKKEILQELLGIQHEMVNHTFDERHAENIKLRLADVAQHLEQKNQEYGNVAEEALQKFKDGCKYLGGMIGREIAGTTGEKFAFRSLETLNTDHIMLQNVELKNGENRAELDAVVITSKAIFLVEIKNSTYDMVIDAKGNYYRARGYMAFDYNIGEKVNNKEYLLRTVIDSSLLKDGKKQIKIVNLVVFANSKITVDNRYKYVQSCFLSQLPHIIDEYSGDDIYSNETMSSIAQCIRVAECTDTYPIDFDFEQFRRNFATVIAMLENAAVSKEEIFLEKEEKGVNQEEIRHVEIMSHIFSPKNVKYVRTAAAVAIGFFTAVATIKHN